MAPDGLDKLKDIKMEIENIRDKAYSLMTDLHELYTMEEDVEDRDAHTMLTNAVSAMAGVVRDADRAIAETQGAYDAEKELMDFYEGLLSKVDNSVEKA